jgi:hypothetical protein
LTVLQVENGAGMRKKIAKAFISAPFGLVDIEAVSSIPLRLLRINSSSCPKHVRSDKRIYEELIAVHLPDLHCLAWQIIGFLFANTQIGTGGFEEELGVLAADQIRSDLKGGKENLSKGSDRALQVFSQLIKSSDTFNGQLFVCELIRSSVLIEVSLKYSRLMIGLLRSGVDSSSSELSETKAKKTRYHQKVNESEQKRFEAASEAFLARFSSIFTFFSRALVVFEAVQGHLSSEDHVSLTEQILLVIDALLKAQRNFEFIQEVTDGSYLHILVESLKNSLCTFQPAYLPPFLPVAMRLLSVLASRADKVGSSSRRALLLVDLLIHPRRLGPIAHRPVSDSIAKLFERTQEIHDVEELSEQPSSSYVSPMENLPKVKHDLSEVNAFDTEITSSSKSSISEAPAEASHPRVLKDTPIQNNVDDENDDDDDELPKIIESGPDE